MIEGFLIEMIFFDKPEASIYSSMQDRANGCYPISDEGIWHAGVHVYFPSTNQIMVKNPIAGTVVASCFDNEKDWNYIILENDIQFPDKTKRGIVGYHCYNLIGNLKGKMPYDDLVNSPAKISEDTLKKLKNIPFYVTLKTILPENTCNDKNNYKIFNVSLDFKNIDNFSKITGSDYDKNKFKDLSADTFVKKDTIIRANGKEIGKVNANCTVLLSKYETGNTDVSCKICGRFIKLNDNLPTGYFILHGLPISKYGNITVPNKNNFNLWNETKTNITKYPGFGLIVKKGSDIWTRIFELMDEEISKGNKGVTTFAEKKKSLEEHINSIDSKTGYVFAMEESKEKAIFPYMTDSCTSAVSYKIQDEKGEAVAPFIFTEKEFKIIRDKFTGWWKGKIWEFYYDAEDIWNNSHFSYTILKRIDISAKYKNFFDSVKIMDASGKYFSKDNLYISDKTKLESSLYAKAKLYLFSDTEYSTVIPPEHIYTQKMYISDKNAIYSFKNTDTISGYPASQAIEKVSGSVEFSNVEAVLAAIREKKAYVWLQNATQNIYVSKEVYQTLKLQVKKNEVKKGDYVGRGEKLGLPFWDTAPEENEQPAAEPYIDYALFFTDDITKQKTTLEKVLIPKGTECLVEKHTFEKAESLVFIPPDAHFITESVGHDTGYVKLTGISYNVYAYAGQIQDKKLSERAETIYFQNSNCRVHIKAGAFISVDTNVTEVQKTLIRDLTHEVIPEMQKTQLEPTNSIDNPPKLLFGYKGKKAYDVIVKSPLAELSRPQFLETFTMQSIFEKATFPADYDDIVTVSKNSETIIEGVKHHHFIVNTTMYLVPQDTVDANKTNLLKEFTEECETVNFGKNALTTNSVCPTDKLIIDNVEQQNIKAYKKALRTRLQEKAPELVGYVHDEEIHTGYNIYANEENTSFYKLLDGYLKRTVSLHPLEWDFEKIRNDKVCETRGKAPVNEHACCDIFADLQKADKNTFKTNSFYFACAPYFYNKMEALGLLFRNPYEGVPVRLRHPISEAERKKVKDKEHLAQTTVEITYNPGFVPAVPSDTNSSKDNKFLSNCSCNGMDFAAVNFCYHCASYKDIVGIPHSGVDFAGTDDGKNKNAPIIALVYGRIWACTAHNGKINESDPDGGYGRVMIIKGDNDKLYLLAHLHDFAGRTAGEYVSPGDIVAHAGNTGNSSGTHLHLEMIQCNLGMGDDAIKRVLDMEYNRLHEKDGGEKGSERAFLKFTFRKKNKNSYFVAEESWKDYRLNPLTGEK